MQRREFLKSAGLAGAGVLLQPTAKETSVLATGAIGNGIANDTRAIQKAIDEVSASGGGRVVLPGKKQYLTGALVLKNRVELHLADDATLVACTDPAAYPDGESGVVTADGAVGASVTGTGFIDGQAKLFVTTYSTIDERWEPKAFRPRIFSLRSCKHLEVRGICFGIAPTWGLHMLGCEQVLVDGIRIRNWMDMPNCDGIDPDRCRDVEIRNCDIVGADDSIVIKTSAQRLDYGPTRNIYVHHCNMTIRDSGVKIGTETFADISRIRFEHCVLKSAGRGPTITHRQPGNIWDVEFNDIEVNAEHHAARWWGWGEAASITAWPRTADGHVGSLRDIRLRNIRGRAENSFRIDGLPDQPIEDVLLENIDLTWDHWSKYHGGKFDNRPTMAGVEGLEPHRMSAYFLRNARRVTVRNCKANWGENRQPDFGAALEAHNVTMLKLENFRGTAAYPGRDDAVQTLDGCTQE
jgi:hypothetical protein